MTKLLEVRLLVKDCETFINLYTVYKITGVSVKSCIYLHFPLEVCKNTIVSHAQEKCSKNLKTHNRLKIYMAGKVACGRICIEQMGCPEFNL